MSPTTKKTARKARPPLRSPREIASFNRNMGVKIREARKEAGIKLYELADTIGRTRIYLFKVERGESNPKSVDLFKISLATKKPVQWFFPK